MRTTKHLLDRIVDRVAEAKGLRFSDPAVKEIAKELISLGKVATEVVQYLGKKGLENYLIINYNNAEWGLGIDPSGKIATTLLDPEKVQRDEKGASFYSRKKRR